MLKISTRLFAAGVIATTLVALNTGAFAGSNPEKKAAGASCCMKKEAVSAHAHKAAAKPAKTVKVVEKDDCACCKKEVKAGTKAPAKAPVKKS